MIVSRSPKRLLSVADLQDKEIWQLLQDAAEIKRGKKKPSLQGQAIALLFEKPSLRTRVSFEVAMWQLGGNALYLSPAEVGLGKREQVPDVARNLSRYVQCIVARTYSHQTIELLAQYAAIPVINALSDLEHPCQALGDLLTISEKKGALKGLNIAFIGDGNNVARSLLLASALAGINFHIACPPGYELHRNILEHAQVFASQNNARIIQTSQPRLAVRDADIVYTDVWVSMGQEDTAETRRAAFASYQVSPQLLSLAKKDAIFMHPLPAHHGEEITEGLLDHPQSVVFDQAENRLHIQKAILAALLENG